MLRYKLRTLLLLLTLGPPVLTGCWFAAARWQSQRDTIAWDDIGGPGKIVWFEISCTFTEDETVAEDEPADVNATPSRNPFGR